MERWPLARRRDPGEHRGLDRAAVEAPNPVAFLRAELVDSGVLEPRDEYSAQFALWRERAVLQIGSGPDRAQVRAYATWHVAHQLARSIKRRGELSYSSLKYARSLVTEAIKLVAWLHQQQLELADLLKTWSTSGSPLEGPCGGGCGCSSAG